MRLLCIFLILSQSSAQAQDLVRVSLSKKDAATSKAHYQWKSKDGHFAIEDLWLLKNGNYEYKYTSNVYSDFSEGKWMQTNGILALKSEIQKDNLPIKVSFRKKDTTDLGVKQIAFLKDLNDSVILNAFIYINNDSTTCLDGDLMCRGSYSVINRIRVQYENYGISSPWVDIPLFDDLLQVTVQTKRDLTNFLVFSSQKYQVVNHRLTPIKE